MKKRFLLLLMTVSQVALSQQQSKQSEQSNNHFSIPGKEVSKTELEKTRTSNIQKTATIQFQYFIIKSGDGFGYSIYADGNLYIQQNTIPAIPGNKSFSDTLSAGKTARLVIQKTKLGEMPPTITMEDLKKSGVQ